jgi:AcrR family transcriptional regulator
LLNAALTVLADDGEEQFSTRAVCAIANVTAPTLYHHYGSANGLLSAAIAEAFKQFLEIKRAALQSTDPIGVLREGWNDYVRFAAARPRLYAAMMSRFLDGGDISAANQAWELLIERVAAIAALGRLAPTVAEAADLLWASANAASLLFVTARLRGTMTPTPEALKQIREGAMRSILKSETEGPSL